LKHRFDMRSLGIGLVLAVAYAVLAGAAGNGAPQTGRFAIGTNEGHMFVLDSATGQVWEKYTAPNGGNTDSDFSAPKIKGDPAP
jgi:hypothetical protein